MTIPLGFGRPPTLGIGGLGSRPPTLRIGRVQPPTLKIEPKPICGSVFKGVGDSDSETHFTFGEKEKKFHVSTYLDLGLGGKTKVDSMRITDFGKYIKTDPLEFWKKKGSDDE